MATAEVRREDLPTTEPDTHNGALKRDPAAEEINAHVKEEPQQHKLDERVLGKYFIGAIDQGTTSSRFIIFDGTGTPVAMHQVEFEQHYPESG